MQQTLAGCAFCDAPLGTEAGEAYTWEKTNESLTRSVLAVPSKRGQALTSVNTTPATGVDWSSTNLQPSRGSG